MDMIQDSGGRLHDLSPQDVWCVHVQLARHRLEVRPASAAPIVTLWTAEPQERCRAVVTITSLQSGGVG